MTASGGASVANVAPLKVLVLGATGHVGARLCALMQSSGWAVPVAASSRAGAAQVRLDTRDEAAMTSALREVQAVVNCVAGSAQAIAQGARVLAAAAAAAQVRRVVHLSTMSVYGATEGIVAEDALLDPGLGWYGQAKIDAERALAALEGQAAVTVLRPGCVHGPGSQLWVERIGRWLEAGRLGDLGEAGDGWSNLVHVDDVCRAVMASLRRGEPGTRTYNLAAPDSPRWNDWFADLAVAIGATPLRRLRPRQVRLDAMLLGPPLHVARKLLARAGRDAGAVPDPITPGLVALWARQLKLDASRAGSELGLRWTPYAAGVQQSARWFQARREGLPSDGLRRLRSG